MDIVTNAEIKSYIEKSQENAANNEFVLLINEIFNQSETNFDFVSKVYNCLQSLDSKKKKNGIIDLIVFMAGTIIKNRNEEMAVTTNILSEKTINTLDSIMYNIENGKLEELLKGFNFEN